MLIVHTSDWHAGRLWKGIDRLPELETVLEDLGDFIEHERVDLLLMSGDVFDSRGPSAAAERAVFRFFRRVGKAGTKTVVIAGNHDDPARLEAWGTLAELVDVATVARPRPADRGGVMEFVARSGERASSLLFHSHRLRTLSALWRWRRTTRSRIGATPSRCGGSSRSWQRVSGRAPPIY
ncbi:MAG: exonuclease subunit SbcD [Alphaproteobacteria bacterium]|nr:exonuclease subunit SbcD [Alphaproteobacteria bacterium]